MRDRADDVTHRRVVEHRLGRKLLPSEVVDHRDEDRTNNADANLTPMDRGAHTAQHNKARGLSSLRRSLRMVKDGRKLY